MQEELLRNLSSCVNASTPLAQELYTKLTLIVELQDNPDSSQTPPRLEEVRDLAIRLWERLASQR